MDQEADKRVKQGWPTWVRELVRKTLHIGVIVLALPLHWLNWWYSLGFALVAFIWNALGMPRYFKFTFREDELKAGYSVGMLSYPIVVMILAVIFPLPIAASQWAALSIGDGFATLFGEAFGTKKLPWNKDKSYAGSLAFVVFATFGSTFFFFFTIDNVQGSSFLWQGHALLVHLTTFHLGEMFLICFLSSVAGAAFESLPYQPIDDNVSAPLFGAITKLLLCYLL